MVKPRFFHGNPSSTRPGHRQLLPQEAALRARQRAAARGRQDGGKALKTRGWKLHGKSRLGKSWNHGAMDNNSGIMVV